jgi:hypothetical protein
MVINGNEAGLDPVAMMTFLPDIFSALPSSFFIETVFLSSKDP